MGAQFDRIARLARPSLHLADALVSDVGEEIFARLPANGDGGTVPCNHPAFAFGHLSLYPAYVLDKLGLDRGGAGPPAGFEALFQPGATCRDDPDGSIYPSPDAVMGHFRTGHAILIECLGSLEDERIDEPNPNEGLRDRLGLETLGEAVQFQLTSHVMFHLGQVSTWRRCMGLGSAM